LKRPVPGVATANVIGASIKFGSKNKIQIQTSIKIPISSINLKILSLTQATLLPRILEILKLGSRKDVYFSVPQTGAFNQQMPRG